MKKLPGVSNVRISLKEGLTILDLKSGNSVTIAELRRIIAEGGHSTKEVKVVAGGNAGGELTFVVSGTSEQLTLQSPPKKNGDDWTMTVRAPEKP